MNFLKLFLTLRWIKAIKSLFQSDEEREFQNLVDANALNCYVQPVLGHSLKQYKRDLKRIYDGINLVPSGIRMARHPCCMDSFEDIHERLVKNGRHSADMWVGGAVALEAEKASGEYIKYRSLQVRMYITWNDKKVELNEVLRISLTEKWYLLHTREGNIPSTCSHCEDTLSICAEEGTCNNCGSDVEELLSVPKKLLDIYKDIRKYEKSSGKELFTREEISKS